MRSPTTFAAQPQDASASGLAAGALPVDPTSLGEAAASSAAKIAHAVASLAYSPGDARASAEVVHNETINQIKRIQSLYNLPPLAEFARPVPSGALKREG